MKKPFYITTPIYFPSGQPHIGHAYSTVAADSLARYKRMQGFDVMFLTGTDEHGQKIEEMSKKDGLSPQKYVDKISANFQKLWERLLITNDRFIRTTDDYHIKSVQTIFEILYKKGEIYKGSYEGLYCTPCEAFWTETQLDGGKCPDCKREVSKTSEEAYFFKLSKYSQRLLDYYQKNPEFILPKSRENEMINNFLKPGLEDLCVSRTSFKWGIPVTFDKNHVVYVWMDALTNYITALGYENGKYSDFQKYWPCDVHFVGKEIVRFHTIIWPAILMALELPLPKQVFGHGWVLLDGGKMSKSKGNVVDPFVLCDRYSVDAVRYFLMREIPFGADGIFSNEALINRINSDLANDLGNLVSRTIAMISKYFGGKLQSERIGSDIDSELCEMTKALPEKYEAQMDSYQFPNALGEIWNVISRANKYIDQTSPWILGKDEKQKPRLSCVLYNLCEVLRICAILLTPIIPETAEKILNHLNVHPIARTYESAKNFGTLPVDLEIVPLAENLFPRIDIKIELEALEKLLAQKKESPKKKIKPEISIDDFNKISIKVAEVKKCEKLKKSNKLLKLIVDDGTSERQVLSGIAKWYSPEDLIGKKIALVDNLKPAKLMGEDSNGMILALDNGDKAEVIFLDPNAENGSEIR